MAEQKLVLVVDDDAWMKQLIKEHLERYCGCVVETSSGLHEAVKKIEAKKYAAIISDNDMGWETAGLDLLRHVRKVSNPNNETPFMLHTGDDRPKTIETVIALKGVHRSKHRGYPLFKDALAELLASEVT